MTQLDIFGEEIKVDINKKDKANANCFVNGFYAPAHSDTSALSPEWYTPKPYVNAARELMGGIDIDPASNAIANTKVVRATTYYDKDTNGLDKPWLGRVWMNPPYGYTNGKNNQSVWTGYLISQYQIGNTTEAVFLVNANTETKWFLPFYNYPICFTNHRIKFWRPKKEGEDKKDSGPASGSAIVYLGPSEKTKNFIELFSPFGTIVGKLSVA